MIYRLKNIINISAYINKFNFYDSHHYFNFIRHKRIKYLKIIKHKHTYIIYIEN